jgi:hypothetical protein
VLNEKLAAPFCPDFRQVIWDRAVEALYFLEPDSGSVLSVTGYRPYTGDLYRNQCFKVRKYSVCIAMGILTLFFFVGALGPDPDHEEKILNFSRF